MTSLELFPYGEFMHILVIIAQAYLIGALLFAWVISYALQDEEYGPMLEMAMCINREQRLFQTFRIMLCGPLIVWFGV
jgi:hypothetical protein